MNLLTQRFLALIFSVQAAVVFPAGAEEIILHPDGLNQDPQWALNRVGKKFSEANTYSYPDTTVPVRLYLIDTAVANPASFVAANPKLTFEGPILVRGSGDPTVSTPRAHGTQLLSLIAGVATGVAPGTPIHVVNYDIYPKTTTTISLLSQAIIKAVRHHRDSLNPMRSVICIATSSAEQTLSATVGDSIDAAVAQGIPVILSAGNIGQDAANIVPSSNGIKKGVICVGASDADDFRLSESNFGAPVDVLAPGLNVRTRSESATSAFVPMTGTSPAAALVAGAVLAKLSASPTHTPAGIESALIAAAESAAAGRLLRSVVAPTSGSIPPDVAPDGPVPSTLTPVPLTWVASGVSAPASALAVSSNELSRIVTTFHHGNNPSQSGTPLPASKVTRSANQEMQFSFPVDGDLFDGLNPFILRNGYTWRIRSSATLSDWSVPVGRLSKSTDSHGRVWLTATFPASQPACFATIEITAP